MKILVTGAAGFIGTHLVIALAQRGHEIVGIDNLNDYYPVSLKYARLRLCGIDEQQLVQGREVRSASIPGYKFCRLDICDAPRLQALFAEEHFDVVVNLAAQAGVRYSIDNPEAYVQSNVVGFLNLLECCRRWPVSHFVYASSSSVYGGNKKVPFSEEDRVDSPVSLYAATKKSNELFASVYSRLYSIPCTGLRFFTVYGPWGRPDMAPMLFGKQILEGGSIRVFNHGDLSRDFTYVDDIVEGIVRVVEKPVGKELRDKVYNIGCGHPTRLLDFIEILENALGSEVKKEMLPMQPGDVHTTFADTRALEQDYGYSPQTKLPEGIAHFAKWYKDYHDQKK